MKKNRNSIIIYSIIGFAILFIISIVLFFKSVSVSQPMKISISGPSKNYERSIKICGITPFGREIQIPFSISEGKWITDNDTYFLKSIKLIISDSIENMVVGILVSFKDKEFSVNQKDLELEKKIDDKLVYRFPKYVRSNNSILKMTKAMFQWQTTSIFFTVLLTFLIGVSIVFLLFIWIIKIDVNKKLKIKAVLIKILLFSIPISIACGLFYGYLLFKYTMTSYISAVLFIEFIGILLWAILQIMFMIIKSTIKYKKKLKKILIIFLLIWFCVESALWSVQSITTYNENIGYYYTSGYKYNQRNKDHPNLLIQEKYSSFYWKTKEYEYEIKSNADGLRDIDRNIEKQKDEFRIICLGNSFTAGYGAPQDSTWPKLLENKLSQKSIKKISVFNAGIGGSDPFFQFKLLEEILLKYKPDLVLVALGKELDFYHERGGFERFTAEGVKYRKAPKLEKLYAISKIFRIINDQIFNYQYFMSEKDYKADCDKANRATKECIYRFYKSSIKENFKFAVIFIDDECKDPDPYLFDVLKEEKVIPVIDLADYNKKIGQLTSQYRTKYYWSLDGHCNSKGYDMWANGIKWNLIRMGLIDTLSLQSPDSIIGKSD